MGTESLAEFELLVMLAAAQLGPDEAYTVSIANEIERRTGRTVQRANVFTALSRLEDKGLISTRVGEPRVQRGGRRPRLVTVRAAGMRAIRTTTEAILAMSAGLAFGGAR